MKILYTALLTALLIIGSGCKQERKTRAFMDKLGCFREEAATAQYSVPGMTNKTLAEAIKYCMEYAIIGVTDASGKVDIYNSSTTCIATQIGNPLFTNILQQNINQPGYWAFDKRWNDSAQEKYEKYVDESVRREGVLDCTYNLDEKTVTIYYEDSRQRKMNFEQLISEMGLAANYRPAADPQ
ncbi:MAG: hypothetical protein GXY61_05220 [Lentisphaerae bacterium]|jgi:hypothetical protein|nr:hypothetical protein [Lentisphaerota bacterium]